MKDQRSSDIVGQVADDEQAIAAFVAQDLPQIDFENIALGVREAKYKSFEIAKVMERLVEKGKVVTKKAYADWDAYGSYKRPFHEAGIELIEVPRKAISGKNSADIRMVGADICGVGARPNPTGPGRAAALLSISMLRQQMLTNTNC